MHLYYAKTIAENIINELQPYCETGKLHIAGSIRRQAEVIKDIEIICVPKHAILEEKNLFQEVIGKRKVIHPEFERIIREQGKIIKGQFTGRQMQIELVRDIEGTHHIINVDLFLPNPPDYFRQLAIRTGSADYAKQYIAKQWLKRGWCGVNGDLRKIQECNRTADDKWILKPSITEPTLPPVWKSEEEFFSWLLVQYLPPQHRNL